MTDDVENNFYDQSQQNINDSFKIRLYGVVHDSIVDGPGLRYTVFTQGCLHHCQGCHNQDSWDLQGGYVENIDTLITDIKSNPLLDGVTISGGEPFLQPLPLITLVRYIKQNLHLHVMIYSGYTYEDILHLGSEEKELLRWCDTLVDGRFVFNLKSLSLLYKGSSNQRIIDVQKSLYQKTVCEQKINEYGEFVD